MQLDSEAGEGLGARESQDKSEKVRAKEREPQITKERANESFRLENLRGGAIVSQN